MLRKEVLNVSSVMLSHEDMSFIENRLSHLEEQGIKASSEPRVELNMSGCARSSCMAWD